MEKNKDDFRYLVLIWILLIAAIIPTYAHHGHFLYDCGREAYYPTQVLAGKVLYKDIFNLYGPFSYLYNAFLYKIFGVNLNTLYISGCLSSFFIVSLTYLIARKFLTPFLSFSIAFFTIAAGVLNMSLFNFVFSYSFGMVYGLVAFMVSVYFLLSYQENKQKVWLLYLSSFFAGICVANKYEFWAFALVILFAMFSYRRLNIKELFFTLISFGVIPFLCFGILFYQGLGVSDLINTAKIMKVTMMSDSLKYFYKVHGVYPTKEFMRYILIFGAKTLFSFAAFFFGWVNLYKESGNRKVLGFLSLFVGTIAAIYFAAPETFIFIPVLIVIITLFRAKAVYKNEAVFLVLLSALTLSLKNFFGIVTLTYGVFYLSFLVLTLIILVFNQFDFFKGRANIVAVYLLISSVMMVYVDLSFTTHDNQTKNFPLRTEKGDFYLDEGGVRILYEMFDYIKMHSRATDKFVVIPEGTFVNFFTDRPSDDFINLLTPVTFEVFGEQTIIDRFKKVSPQFVILHDSPMASDYKYNNICTDYAFKFCEYINHNYNLQQVFGVTNFRFYMFKRNV